MRSNKFACHVKFVKSLAKVIIEKTQLITINPENSEKLIAKMITH